MNKIFVANWKANITTAEMREWLQKTREALEKSEHEIVICPSFVSLEVAAWELRESKIKLGAQNVSQFPTGAYTGEVAAAMLKDIVKYCIVGHSERKKYFGEAESDIAEKVKQLLEVGITPILCVAEIEQLTTYMNNYSHIKEGSEKIIFVYEPPSAISGGGDFHPESSDNAANVVKSFKEKIGAETQVLYGGSVNPEVINEFLATEIDGFLVGKASLDPENFVALVSKS